MSLQCIFLQTTTLHCAYDNSNKVYDDLLKESTISHFFKKRIPNALKPYLIS